MKHLLLAILCMIPVLVAGGCGSAYQAPVDDTASGPRYVTDGRLHRVNAGETLYAIAWIYDLDFRLLAQVNDIDPPYTIYTGQLLSVDVRGHRLETPAPAVADARASSAGTSIPRQRDSTPAPSSPAPARSPAPGTSPAPTPPAAEGPLRWNWPAQGNIVSRFGSGGSKGIDIAGNAGEAVRAAASGEIVYAGSGLLRYGDMIIIKHNERYLSAYAHNRRLLVAEGERVSQGQQIAELGSTGIDRSMLHFEIRDNGKPVDPMEYLPSR